MTDPSKEFIDPKHPGWAPYGALLQRLKGSALPSTRALTRLLPPGTVSVSGQPIRFVPEGELEPQDYELRVHESGRVATRRDNLHDVCNALVWARWPRLKAALNALHLRGLPQSGNGRRGPLRDAATLFDECGLILCSDDADLLDALRERHWSRAFLDLRDRWTSVRPLLVGHGVLERLHDAHRGLTAKALLAFVPADLAAAGLSVIDARLARGLLDENWLSRPDRLSPLPLAGIPGWWRKRQDAGFYADRSVFRPPRADAVLAPIRHLDSAQGHESACR